VVKRGDSPHGGKDAFLAAEMTTVTPCVSSLIMALVFRPSPALVITICKSQEIIIISTSHS